MRQNNLTKELDSSRSFPGIRASALGNSVGRSQRTADKHTVTESVEEEQDSGMFPPKALNHPWSPEAATPFSGTPKRR